ncbi:hypothetical protein VXS06_14550 [Photobacterium toruni]|uniref:Uncharacterized protein n=1 Tax=Photobacterium toruni TaxID=1935446 RepID=A0ABU6L8U9_9GAMM|nr:hypothetical protein [Photobacterium toruni]
MKSFLIAGGTYELSAINEYVVITRKYPFENAIAELSVSFPVKTHESAKAFVSKATVEDITRGIAKMNNDLLIANKLGQALTDSLTKQPVTANYSKYINKHLKS